MDAHDTRFMQHALDLARKAVGLASPNPLVGCVIVQNGEIVGQGFHEYEGRSHAEVLALRAAGEKARGATLYVTLEPCNHTGRTGPCTKPSSPRASRAWSPPCRIPTPWYPAAALKNCAPPASRCMCDLLEDQARAMNEAVRLLDHHAQTVRDP